MKTAEPFSVRKVRFCFIIKHLKIVLRPELSLESDAFSRIEFKLVLTKA